MTENERTENTPSGDSESEQSFDECLLASYAKTDATLPKANTSAGATSATSVTTPTLPPGPNTTRTNGRSSAATPQSRPTISGGHQMVG